MPKAVKSDKAEASKKESQSFTMNLFRGQLQTSQVFPYPEPLNEDQVETLKMFIDPVEKFFEVIFNFLNLITFFYHSETKFEFFTGS